LGLIPEQKKKDKWVSKIKLQVFAILIMELKAAKLRHHLERYFDSCDSAHLPRHQTRLPSLAFKEGDLGARRELNRAKTMATAERWKTFYLFGKGIFSI
jgi:hypothetical protein